MRKLILTCAVVAGVVASAVAALSQSGSMGLWLGFPQLGGPSYCSSTVNGVCTNTVPAGPAITGNEVIPADTHAAGGQQPQSGIIPLAAIGAGPYDYEVPLTGATITETAQQNDLIIDPAGTIAALTIVLPVSTTLVDGQRWGMCTTQIVSTLTLTAGSGTTIKDAPTAMLVPVATGAASCFKFRYIVSKTAWYRTQ